MTQGEVTPFGQAILHALAQHQEGLTAREIADIIVIYDGRFITTTAVATGLTWLRGAGAVRHVETPGLSLWKLG